MYTRYAIFYTPSAGKFAAFGAAWLGWDSATGTKVPHLQSTGLDLETLTATPRKYGFHATLKAPFYAAGGVDEMQMRAALEAFAADHAPVALGELRLSTQNGFLSLRPTAPPETWRPLVSALVRALDPLRAPLTEADIARRRKTRLTVRQDEQMLNWGYPYVFEDFDFHMTLSGRIKRDADADILATAGGAVETFVPDRPVLDAITLMGQDADGMFHQLHRAHLA